MAKKKSSSNNDHHKEFVRSNHYDYKYIILSLALVVFTIVGIRSEDFAWAMPSAALSGTLIDDTAFAEDIVSGGQTLIITLSGTTWDATIGADNAKTTDLINGICADASPDYGWNNVVKASMTSEDIDRLSDTVVQITLGPETAYAITASETITVTVPAVAIAAASPIIATPTFDIICDYASYKLIIIDSDKVEGTSDLTDFPLLVDVTDDNLAHTGSGGDVTDVSGDDIIFRCFDAATCGGSAPCTLDHEIEEYDNTTGRLVAWVRIPTLSYNEDTALYLYYGSSCVTSPTENPEGVWDPNFVGVWHLSDTDIDGGAGDIEDSTNALNGTTHNMEGNEQAPGKIGGSFDFDGTDDYIQTDYLGISGNASRTISCWVKVDTWTDKEGVWRAGWIDTAGKDFSLEVNETAGSMHFQGWDADFDFTLPSENFGWHLVTITHDGSTTSAYVDGGYGNSKDQTLDTGDVGIFFGSTRIFDNLTLNSTYYFDGIIDEVRVSNKARSASWIATEYNNQSSPSTFYRYVSPTANLSGTLAYGALLGDIVSGGKTLIITLTNATWDATIGADNAKTTALINGICAAASPDYGWNNVVKASMTYEDIERLSDTVVQITLSPEETYAIEARETITVTVPAEAISIGVPLVAATTFDIVCDYAYYKLITIDADKVEGTSDLTDFPFLFDVTDDNLAYTGNGGDVTDVSGDDIIFRCFDATTCGGSAPCTLDHEIEEYDNTTGRLVAWVRIPTLSYDEDTTIYLYYGNSCVTSPTENPEGVWDPNYMGVWHLEEQVSDEATSGTHYDSTSKDNDGIQNNNGPIAGKISDGQYFDGDDYVALGEESYWDGPIAGKTFTFWFQRKGAGSEGQGCYFILTKGAGSNMGFAFGENVEDGLLVARTNSENAASNLTLVDDTWYHIAIVPSETNFNFYINGSFNTAPAYTWAGSNNYDLTIGKGITSYINGIIDEVRISNTARSAEWIATEYNNQSSPSTFYAITTLSLADHASGQETDTFGTDSSVSGAELFAFQLTAAGEDMTVDQVQLQLSSITGIVQDDCSNFSLSIDNNNNGVVDMSETVTVGGNASIDISGATGTITFTEDFAVSAGTTVNYILKGSVRSLMWADTVSISLGTSNIVLASGSVGGVNTTNATHTSEAAHLSLSDHTSGQETDAFGFVSCLTGAELFAFKLTAGSFDATVDEVQFQLSSLAGIYGGDFSNLYLYVDSDGNGTADDVTVGGDASVDITGSIGTITFEADFTIPAYTSVDYIVVGDVNNLTTHDALTLALGANTITLSSGSVGGSDVLSVTHEADDPSLVADFSVAPSEGTVPLSVRFTDQSTGYAEYYAWDFGDGGSSTESDPNYTYTTVGDFTITLTISNSLGIEDSKVAQSAVRVTPAVDANTIIIWPSDENITQVDITDDIVIAEDEVVTIEPGTEVRFVNDASLTIHGAFYAVGTASSPILFTTSGESWEGITITSSESEASIQHCIFEKVLNEDGAALTISSMENTCSFVAENLFTHNTNALRIMNSCGHYFRNRLVENTGTALYIDNNSSCGELIVNQNLIAKNAVGIKIQRSDSELVIVDNNFQASMLYHLDNESSGTVTATENWWCIDPNFPSHTMADFIGDSQNDPNKGAVDYTNYLDAPSEHAPIPFVSELRFQIAENASGTGATLSWAPVSASDIQGYRIYTRHGSEGSFAMLAEVMAETSFMIEDFTADLTYALCAFDEMGNEGEKTMTPSQPTGVSMLFENVTPDYNVGIFWDESPASDFLIGYWLYYGTSDEMELGALNPDTCQKIWVSAGYEQLLSLENDITYYVCLSSYDVLGNWSMPGPQMKITTTSDEELTYQKILPGGDTWAYYQMISIPFQAEDATQQLVDQMGEYDPTAWRVFRYNPQEGDEPYVEFNEEEGEFTSLCPGEAAWIINAEDKTVTFSGYATDASSDYAITIQPGWNQIGNPFHFPVSWEDVYNYNAHLVKNALYHYNYTQDPNNCYEQSGQLVPGEGYWIKNISESEGELIIPPISQNVIQPRMRSLVNPFDHDPHDLPPSPPRSQNPVGDGWTAGRGECFMTVSHGRREKKDLVSPLFNFLKRCWRRVWQ